MTQTDLSHVQWSSHSPSSSLSAIHHPMRFNESDQKNTTNKSLSNSLYRSRGSERSVSRFSTETSSKPMLQSTEWQRRFKQQRLAHALAYNLLLQFFLLILFGFRLSFDLWGLMSHIFSRNIILYICVFCSSQALLIALARHSSVCLRGQLPFSRIFEVFSRTSTFYLISTFIITTQIQFWMLRRLNFFSQLFSSDEVNVYRYAIGLVLFSLVIAITHCILDNSVLRFPCINVCVRNRLKARVPTVITVAISTVLVFETAFFFIPQHTFSSFAGILPEYELLPNSFALRAELSFLVMLFYIMVSASICLHVIEVIFTDPIPITHTTQFMSMPLEFLFPVLNQKHDLFCQYSAALHLRRLCERSQSARRFIFSHNDGLFFNNIVSFCTSALDSLSVAIFETVHRPQLSRWVLFDVSRQRTQQLFVHTPMLIALSQALSFLGQHSMNDDDIGVYQRSFEQIISSLLSLALAIEQYTNSNSFALPSKTKDLKGRQIIRREPLALSAALDNAIYRLVTAFYSHLKQFSLPREHAKRLKRYASFDQ